MAKLDSNISDKDLIDLCLERDRSAQEFFYRKYADKMFSVCKHYASDRDQACEFLQIGFIKVFESLKKFNFSGSLEGWLRRIIVNTALQELRKQKIFHLDVEEIQIAVETVEDTGISKLPFGKVIELINDLPKKAGLVIKLYAIEGFSHKEISDNLGISVSTSKSQLNYARSLLSQKVSGLRNE